MIISQDLGTSSVKASLYDDRAGLVASATRSYPTHLGPGGAAEQDPEVWWQAVVDSTRELLVTTGVDKDAVAGICVAGQMMGAVCLDAAMVPVRPAMIWSDQRATAQSARFNSVLGSGRAYLLGSHKVAAGYTAPKLMWVRDNEPEVWQQVRHVCVAKDYVNMRLTGVLVIDHSDASSTGVYDINTQSWSPELLDAAGLDVALFPPIVESTAVVGTLRPDVADLLGLNASTHVIAGGGDGPMANVGAACVSPHDNGYVCIGTSAWFSTTTSEPLFDPLERSFSYRAVVPGLFTPCATTQTGAGSLDWFLRASSENGARIDTGARIAEACQVPAADDGLYFVPYLLGERTPWWNPAATGVLAGVRMHHQRPHLTRAILEGVGFSLALCMQPLGTPADLGRPVSVIGGGARSDEWLQLLATIWGTPVQRRSAALAGTGLGAAITGLVGLGRAEFTLAREVSTVVAEFLPEPGAERYRAHLDRFVQTYQAMTPWFSAAGGRP